MTLPPLRARPDDVPTLVHHFVEKLRERTCSPVRDVSGGAIEKLSEYTWPGNVRELENVVERALVLADGAVLEVDDLPILPSEAGGGRQDRPGVAAEDQTLLPSDGTDLNQLVESLEEKLLRQALEKAGGVKAEAARLLGLKASALYYKLDKYGIDA